MRRQSRYSKWSHSLGDSPGLCARTTGTRDTGSRPAASLSRWNYQQRHRTTYGTQVRRRTTRWYVSHFSTTTTTRKCGNCEVLQLEGQYVFDLHMTSLCRSRSSLPSGSVVPVSRVTRGQSSSSKVFLSHRFVMRCVRDFFNFSHVDSFKGHLPHDQGQSPL